MTFGDVFAWFSGGRPGYMDLRHCMNHDTFWILITVVLDLAVAVGYVLIALHWRLNERALADSPAKSALGMMKNIFIFCGLCGYLFIPVKMFWPAWRLYDGFLAVLVYLTWRYALGAKELRVVYNELGRSARLALDLEQTREESRKRGHFLNAVSHDLKTPLNRLNLQTELAEISMASDDQDGLRESLAEILECTAETTRFLNRLLEIGQLEGRTEAVDWREFALADLLEALSEAHRPGASARGLTIESSARTDLTVESDPALFSRVLSNLIDNAIKFSGRGKILLLAEARSDGVAVHVTDEGEGIAPEDLGRIFDDFVQLHNPERDSRKGFGLGLGVAKRLAHLLGGRLAVESGPGRGSRFTVTLPRKEPADRTGPGGNGEGA